MDVQYQMLTKTLIHWGTEGWRVILFTSIPLPSFCVQTGDTNHPSKLDLKSWFTTVLFISILTT